MVLNQLQEKLSVTQLYSSFVKLLGEHRHSNIKKRTNKYRQQNISNNTEIQKRVI